VKYKVGDRVRYVVQRDIDNVKVGEVGIIRDISSGGDYAVDFEESGFKHNCGGLCQNNHGWWCSGDTLEPVAPTLAEIKEKKLTCVIHTKTKREAIMLVEILGVDEERLYDKNDFIECWDGHKENTCYRIRNGKVDQMDCVKFYQKINEEIYEFSDLFATGGVLPTTELIKKEFNVTWIDKIALPTATETKEMVARVRQEIFKFTNAFPKEEEKMSTKFTFYVTEGTRVDKSCNGTIPTMTTNIELLSGNVFDKVTTVKGSATCDKADYDERQGVLEALANAICGGNFYKAYAEAVKLNRCEDELSRTCIYCGKVLDTVEEKQEHEAWHVERRKARHERYLLRKRAKEITFEEQAQKMAKEMMGEQK